MELDYQIFSSIQASSRRVNEGASPAGIVRSARSLMGFASLGGSRSRVNNVGGSD